MQEGIEGALRHSILCIIIGDRGLDKDLPLNFDSP